jgi:E3 ubiquitin-protein ligase SHPRH
MVSKKKQFLHSLSPLPERHNHNNDNKRGKCPTCRQECATKEISYVTWKSQDKDVRDNVEEAQKKREERLRKKAEESLHLSRFGADVSKMLETLGAPETHARDESGIKIEGAWGTKIDAVVRRVKHLSKFDTNLKVLIFSEWEDVLMIVDHALKMNGVNSIVPTSAASSSLKTKRAGSRFAVCVKEFVDSDSHPVSCLLLPLKRAGAGLNLTCANHVILLEPSLDISAESQAIKRIDRIGQTKSTIIHRFVLKDSIEKNVMKVIENRRSEGTVLPVDSKEASKLTARDIEELLKQQQ